MKTFLSCLFALSLLSIPMLSYATDIQTIFNYCQQQASNSSSCTGSRAQNFIIGFDSSNWSDDTSGETKCLARYKIACDNNQQCMKVATKCCHTFAICMMSQELKKGSW